VPVLQYLYLVPWLLQPDLSELEDPLLHVPVVYTQDPPLEQYPLAQLAQVLPV